MAQVCRIEEELQRRQAQVLIVSFSAPAFARAWLEETGAPFRLLVDPERAVYRRYGLEASFRRTWSPRTIWYYVRHWSSRPRWKGGDEDLTQLGGDFIVDAGGVLRFVHHSVDPVDRPSTEELLAVL